MSVSKNLETPVEAIKNVLDIFKHSLLKLEGRAMPSAPVDPGKSNATNIKEFKFIRENSIPAHEEKISSCEKAIQILTSYVDETEVKQWPQPLDVVEFQFRQYQLLKIRHNGHFQVGAVMNLNTHELQWLPIEELTKPKY